MVGVFIAKEKTRKKGVYYVRMALNLITASTGTKPVNNYCLSVFVSNRHASITK